VLVPLQPIQLATACAVIALGSLVQGSVGFGMAVVAAPLLVLIDPILVPGPTIVVGMVLSGFIGFRERRAVDTVGIRAAFPGLLSGSMIAAFFLTFIAIDIGVTLGVLVLVAVLLSLVGPHVQPTASNVFYASTLAGFMSTTASISGPPLALVYQHSAGPRLRATLAPLFILCGTISLATLVVVGRFGWTELMLGMMLIPGALLGVYLSTFTASFLDRGSVRWGVLVVAVAAGVAAIWQGTK
jgi:hypothetical protein